MTPLGSSPSGSAPSGTAPRGGSAQGRGRGGRGGSSRGGSARGGSTSRGGRGSTGGRGSRGGRGPAPARPVTRSVAKQPYAKTICEIRRLSYAFNVKGEFPDVTRRDGSFQFTEHAYAVGTSQPDGPKTIQEARAMPDAAEWETAANRDMTSLKERKVYKSLSARPFLLGGSASR